jgi:hypothetical protein
VNIKTFKYQPYRFIEEAAKLKYNFLTTKNVYTHRLLSLHFNISELSKYILDSSEEYDFTILTRYDMLSQIKGFGDIYRFKEPNTIFLWRTCPYVSNEDAEDRIIVTSKLGLEKLSSLYHDHTCLQIQDNDCYSEKIIGKQLNLYKELIKREQNIVMELSPFMHIKYSQEFNHKCDELLHNYMNKT